MKSTNNPGWGVWGVYLELVTLSTDTAGQAWLLYQLLHLLQQWGLGHHLTLLIGLKGKCINHKLKQKSTVHWAVLMMQSHRGSDSNEQHFNKVKKKKGRCTVMPSVPRAFCLMAIAIRFFSALVSLRAASIFRLTSLCSLRASRRFSASVPMPSSLDTCSSLCKLVIESVPISTWTEDKKASSNVN